MFALQFGNNVTYICDSSFLKKNHEKFKPAKKWSMVEVFHRFNPYCKLITLDKLKDNGASFSSVELDECVGIFENDKYPEDVKNFIEKRLRNK